MLIRAEIAEGGSFDSDNVASLDINGVIIWSVSAGAAVESGQLVLGHSEVTVDLNTDTTRQKLISAFSRIFEKNSADAVCISLRITKGDVLEAEGRWLSDYDGFLTALSTYISGDGAVFDGEPENMSLDQSRIRTIAYYLPQFHPFQENNKWWGEGFTEWASVLSGSPNYVGHKQPNIPADLGFYDLRLKQARDAQAVLASEYGVDGFAYHFYWFSGRRIMGEILDQILLTGSPSTDFCLCWANETWSRRWDGAESEVLIRQEHDPEKDVELVRDLLPFFNDPRYIRVDGSPLLIIYRLGLMNEPERIFKAWNEAARAEGFPGIHIVAAETFGLTADQAKLVNAVVEFPPHAAPAVEITKTLEIDPQFEGKIYDYLSVIENSVGRDLVHPVTYPAIMPGWDNTARRGLKSHIYHGATGSAFKLWARLSYQRALALPEPQRFLFVNAWNEWAEGAVLEPSRRNGRTYLEALRQARGGYVSAPTSLSRFMLQSGLLPSGSEQWIERASAEIDIVAQLQSRLRRKSGIELRTGFPPAAASGVQKREGSVGHIEYSSSGLQGSFLVIDGSNQNEFVGWAIFDPEFRHVFDRCAYICLTDDAENILHHAPLFRWSERSDVAEYHGIKHAEAFFGFQVNLDAQMVPEGEYRLILLQPCNGECLALDLAKVLKI